MTQSNRDDAAEVAATASVIVARLGDRLGEVVRSVQQYLLSQVSELRGDARLVQLLHDSIEQNVDAVFSAIRHSVPIEQVEVPAAALAYARRLAQQGVAPNALTRAYPLAHQEVLNMVLIDLRRADMDQRRCLDVFEQISVATFNYVDRISQQVLAAYQTERDRWLETQNSTRALRVRDLLDADAIDVDAIGNAIGYSLRRTHLAVVVWSPETNQGDELVRMEGFVREVAESVDSQGPPLFVAADKVTGWGWVPLSIEVAQLAVARIRGLAETHTEAPSIAIGDPLSGAAGFRRSHQQALAARAVAVAAGAHAQTVVTNCDPGLSAAALLTQSIDPTRTWVGEVLGPLASATEGDDRLRETLRIFLQTGSSYKAAASELNMHFNTVKYRVRRAEERRGRAITTDRFDVELALLLCHWFQTAVLH